MRGFCFHCGKGFYHDDNGSTVCSACQRPPTWGSEGLAEPPEYVARGDDVQAPFTLLVDAREQHAYTFRSLSEVHKQKTVSVHVPVKICTIPAGDYSIDGFCGRVAVERKTLADFLQSFGSNRDCEERKLAKLGQLQVAWYVLEFTYADLLFRYMPYSQVNRKSMSRSIQAYQVAYPNVHWFFANDRPIAESLTYRLLERWHWAWVGKPAKELAKAEKAKAKG